jgi:hypothetical protein
MQAAQDAERKKSQRGELLILQGPGPSIIGVLAVGPFSVGRDELLN